MRKAVLLSMLVTAVFFYMVSAAGAEKFYFYKETGKKLPRGQEYDSARILAADKGIPGGFQIHFNLPKQYWRGNKNEVDLSFGTGVNQTSNDPSRYWFFIEDLAIRDGEGRVYSLYYDKGYEQMTAQARATVKDYRRKVAVESMNGHIRTKYEVDVYRGETYGEQLTFEASSLPKHLFIDYKLRIRKEGSSTKVFEGTIQLERASYHVSIWEKMRY